MSNLKIVQLGGAGATVVDKGATLTLNEDAVENQSTGGEDAITAGKLGALTIDGGSVTMEDGASGYAVEAVEAPASLSGVTVTDGGLAEAGGVKSRNSTLSMQNSSATVEGGTKEEDVGIIAEEDTSVSLQNDSVRQEGVALGVALEGSPSTVDALKVKMGDASNKVEGVGAAAANSTFDHLEVSGAWAGLPFLALGGNVTLSDSRLIANTIGAPPALEYLGVTEDSNLLVQRSVLEAAPKASPGVLEALNANATIDSTEIFGGTDGVSFKTEAEGTRTLTLASSTMGAPPGISFEPSGVVGVEAEALGKHASTANVTIEGSIVFESQVATAASGDHASVACLYSAVPSQIQTANALAHKGEIACASGASANTNSSAELASLFAEPLHNYTLSPSSSAIDSVPVSAITLPFGLIPSTTDLEGNPRFESLACNLVQDKGALELPGHGTPCPTSTTTTPTTTTSPPGPPGPPGPPASRLRPSSAP